MTMKRGAKAGIIGAVFAGMVGVAGYGAYHLYTGLDAGGGSPGAKPFASAAGTTSPPSARDVTRTADAFLAAWSAGDTAKAARLTDAETTAAVALGAYTTDAHVSSVRIAPGTPAGTRVPFTVSATVSYPGVAPSQWTYGSSLTVVRVSDGKPAVKWASSVLHPALADGDTLVTGQARTPDVDIVDRDGRVMDLARYPSLTEIVKELRTRYAGTLHTGTPGIQTYVVAPDGTQKADLHALRKGVSARLRTTLDSGLQAAAEAAVTKEAGSGVSALDTRTGGILAVAFSPATGTDLALQSPQAPGSTFKIVTATALLNAGLTPATKSQCVSGYNYKDGKPYRNVSPDNLGATLAWDFAQSCNTGFIRLADHIGPRTLTDTGRRYFGLGPIWYVGTTTADGSIPGGTGDELTSEMIGQGNVQMTTLDMASVAATVRDGRFHQPSILQDTGAIAKRTAIVTDPLPYGVKLSLQSMMRQTVTSGTAYGAMHGLTGKVGAKTGSAEAGAGQPNGWFTGYRDHVAAAALVLRGGHGGRSAGPIVAAVLAAS